MTSVKRFRSSTVSLQNGGGQLIVHSWKLVLGLAFTVPHFKTFQKLPPIEQVNKPRTRFGCRLVHERIHKIRQDECDSWFHFMAAIHMHK